MNADRLLICAVLGWGSARQGGAFGPDAGDDGVFDAEERADSEFDSRVVFEIRRGDEDLAHIAFEDMERPCFRAGGALVGEEADGDIGDLCLTGA